ncbi:MAG: ABC transporter substrate-binding protein [Granulosicoccus sp.]|nr:ABC transporter substrate-binding protein [Granulosicoccus sp.]
MSIVSRIIAHPWCGSDDRVSPPGRLVNRGLHQSRQGRLHWHVLVGLVMLIAALPSQAIEPDAGWQEALQEARGQSVYFHAWGGSEQINRYLAWVAERVDEEYGVTLRHVKVGDIAEVVSQLQAARLVGRHDSGNVDLMWVNGENFAALKHDGLLWGDFARHLPNASLLRESPSISMDFSVPVEGLESAWGGAQLVFIHDTATVKSPPRSATALLEFVRDGGRFAYPAPPAFHGTTFVKQLLIELNAGKATSMALYDPVTEANLEAVTAPLWAYLDELHPLMRGAGESWPVSGEMTRQLLDDGELDIAISFNPNAASAAVANGQLPDTVRTYVFDQGTIGNTHFVTIPWNARAKAGARVVANFLLSPEAQARKLDPRHWGDPTVLDLSRLRAADKAVFAGIDVGVWSLAPGSGSVLAEPHASWTEALEAAWVERYGQ